MLLASAPAVALSHAMPRTPGRSEAPAPSPASLQTSPASELSGRIKGTAPVGKEEVLAAAKKAVRFLMESVSNRGGFLSVYTSDLSDQWGEIPARKSQVWVQAPGTVSMGRAPAQGVRRHRRPRIPPAGGKGRERPRLRPAPRGRLALFHRFRPAGDTGVLRNCRLPVLGLGGVLSLRRQLDVRRRRPRRRDAVPAGAVSRDARPALARAAR